MVNVRTCIADYFLGFRSTKVKDWYREVPTINIKDTLVFHRETAKAFVRRKVGCIGDGVDFGNFHKLQCR